MPPTGEAWEVGGTGGEEGGGVGGTGGEEGGGEGGGEVSAASGTLPSSIAKGTPSQPRAYASCGRPWLTWYLVRARVRVRDRVWVEG